MDHLQRAIEIATESAGSDGGPFGCVIVTERGVYEGRNDVVARHDPTAHAEIQAIREACRAEGTHDLTGAVLYASGQPCPMCFAAIHWARIDTVLYAATNDQAAAAGFDDSFISEVACGNADGPVAFRHAPQDNDNAPFDAWAANDDRVQY
ncbi:guanine deaminase [Corynebacterium mycetoides]|uniref:Guanine deaminase n=1 Tax=Corynebacterium mycetoides TaxID=38302 RepID=A0A1G9N3U1_9CORY|nr:nucleoside deaminase [Corynebacterium mycetoides]SDL81158.1 guanine deaminase [Corynebacterium mycetoides]